MYTKILKKYTKINFLKKKKQRKIFLCCLPIWFFFGGGGGAQGALTHKFPKKLSHKLY